MRAAQADRKARGGWPWFLVGLTLFCLLVALEEISWGQRLLGYQPPEYFLAENFQQEFNLHNVMDTDLRKDLLLLILLGYGVFAALLGLVPALRQQFDRLRIVVPPVMVAPAFALTGWIYFDYPWRFTGDWVEMAAGLAFLSAALTQVPPGGTDERRLPPLLWQPGVVAVLAVATLGLQWAVRPSSEEALATARAELELLARDIQSRHVQTRCGLHRRLYTFKIRNRQPYLGEGRFAQTLQRAGDAVRGEYLLDPWNSPYWVHHKCDDGRVSAYVYSFGPDRQRDSTIDGIVDDDLGVYLYRSDR